MAGALLAFVAHRIASIPRPVGQLLSAVGLAIIIWCSFVYTDLTPFPGFASIPPVLATVLLIVGGGTTGIGITAALSARLPVRLGDLSYSWYLWHWPAIVFTGVLLPDSGRATAIVAGFASLGVAWLSYMFVEEWFRHNDRWQGRWSVALAVGCIAIPVLAMAGLRAGADRLWNIDGLEEVAAFNQLHGDVTRGCDETQGRTWEPTRCTWSAEDGPGSGSTAKRPTVLLLGDSHAGHLTEAVTGAGKDLGYDVVVRTWSACPFLLTELTYTSDQPADGCQAFVDDAITYAIDTGPEAVVISTAMREYLTDGSITLGSDAELFDRSPDHRIETWRSGFEAVLARLQAADIPVLVVQPLPVFEDWSLGRCAMTTVATNPEDCGTTAPRDELLSHRAPFAKANQQAADRWTGISTIDLFDQICPSETCATNDGTTFLYRDGDHLTVDRATELAPGFAAALTSLGAEAR